MKNKTNKKLIITVLAALPILVYYPTLWNDFLYNWDDQFVVVNQYTSGGWTLANLSAIFGSFYGGQYSPITQTMYLLTYSLFGYNPAAFHAVSLILHICNALFLYVLIRKLFKMPKTDNFKHVGAMAFITALLFVVHPVNVEAVAWVSAAKVTLFACFYLFGLIMYLRYIETNRLVFFVATLISFVLSFGSKEQAVTFPLCLLVIDWFLHRNLRSSQVWEEKLPFFVLALFFGLLTVMAQGPTSGMSNYPLWQRLLFSCYAMFEYITKSIIPLNLNYLYPFPMDPGESIPLRFWIYPFLLTGLICMLAAYRKNRLLMFGVLFLIANIALSLNIISLGRFAMIADRYLYIGEAGIFLILAYLGVNLYEQFCKPKYKRKLLIILALLYLLYLGGYTNTYIQKWKDSDTVKRYLKELADKENRKKLTEETVEAEETEYDTNH
jgi:hypothetical protein